jgi:hypothetical protein
VVSPWPQIDEQELVDRLAMDDAQFAAYIGAFIRQLPSRTCDAAAFARACGYPWERPAGSYRLTDDGVELLAALSELERARIVEQFSSARSGRLPLLAIGSNAAPDTLVRKFAHFEAADDRAVLALRGRLHEFDVGVSAHPALYGAMPATLFPSAGTAVQTTLLWVTPAQFTQLTWSELSYRLGRLRTRFALDDGALTGFDEVLVFVSRWGAFCVDGAPVALAAVRAHERRAAALTQEQVLDAAAALAFGPDARAETLVHAVFEDFAGIVPTLAATVHKAALPFASERWTPYRALLPAPSEIDDA